MLTVSGPFPKTSFKVSKFPFSAASESLCKTSFILPDASSNKEAEVSKAAFNFPKSEDAEPDKSSIPCAPSSNFDKIRIRPCWCCPASETAGLNFPLHFSHNLPARLEFAGRFVLQALLIHSDNYLHLKQTEKFYQLPSF